MSTAEISRTALPSLSDVRAREAMAALDRGLRAAPTDPVLLQMKAGAAWQAGDLYAADDALRTLIVANGGDTPATDLMVAQLALDLLEFDRSRAAIDRLLASDEQSTSVVRVAVRLLVWQGEREQALDILEKGLAADPGDPHLLALAITHDRAITAARLAQAEALAQSLPEQGDAKTGLLYPLARDHDRKGDYQRAWDLMQQANQLSAERMGLRFDAFSRTGLKDGLITRTTRGLGFAKTLTAVTAKSDQRHIYLVGAPRTGSSLLQSILAAHDGVQSAGERGALLPYLNGLCDQSGATPPPGFLNQIQAADLSGLARAGLTAPILIDKTTHNLFIAPLIAAIHPGARFVNVMRRPQDIALSMLLHDFPSAFPEACDLGAIIAMLEARAEIVALYTEAGFEITQFDFDAFTAAPEQQGEALAKMLDLDWQSETLQPENRVAAVPTFSAGQVRKPITPTPADKWRRFEAFMSSAEIDALAALNTATW